MGYETALSTAFAGKQLPDDAVIRVYPRRGDDSADGLSWGSAKKTLAAAVAAAVAGATILIAGGTAPVVELDLTKDNLTIEGIGHRSAVLDCSGVAGANAIVALYRTGILLRNLRINGGGKGSQPVNVVNPTAADLVGSGSGVIFVGCTKTRTENVYFYNHGGTNGMAGTNGVAGLWLTRGSSDNVVTGCTFDKCRNGFNEDNYFLAAAGSNNQVYGNTAVGCRFGFAIESAVAGEGTKLTFNTARDCIQSGFDINGARFATIIGNFAKNCGLENGASGFMAYNGSIYNTFVGNGAEGNVGNGFKFDNVRYNTITGNQSDFNGRHGFMFSTNAQNNAIGQNVARNNSQESDNSYDNYHYASGASKNNASGNISLRLLTEAKQPRYGMRIDSADCLENELWFNALEGSGKTADFSDSGSGTVSVRKMATGSAGVDGSWTVQRAASTSAAYHARVSGESNPRFSVLAGGEMLWGPGASTFDTRIYRDAPNQLRMGEGDSFLIDGTWDGGRLRLGAYHLWVGVGGELRMKNGVPTSQSDGVSVGSQP